MSTWSACFFDIPTFLAHGSKMPCPFMGNCGAFPMLILKTGMHFQLTKLGINHSYELQCEQVSLQTCHESGVDYFSEDIDKWGPLGANNCKHCLINIKIIHSDII